MFPGPERGVGRPGAGVLFPRAPPLLYLLGDMGVYRARVNPLLSPGRTPLWPGHSTLSPCLFSSSHDAVLNALAKPRDDTVPATAPALSAHH